MANSKPGTSTTRAHHGRKAAAQVDRKQHLTVGLPRLGQLTLPQPQDLAYVAGIAVLVALELIEWPVAVALGVGHALSSQHRSQALTELGEALDNA